MKRFRFYKTVFIANVLVILLTPLFLYAEEELAGKVIAVRGEVLATDGKGAKRVLKMESPIFRHDTIRTGARGRAQILFLDNTIVSIGDKSELVIPEYTWDPEKNQGAMTAKINEGVFRVMGGAITKASPEKFKTETLSATIGIRGSMFSGKVDGESLTVLFEGGKGIEVTNTLGSVVITRAGFGTLVQSVTEPPIPPIRFSASQIRSLNVEGAAESKGAEQTETDSDEAEVAETEESDTSADGTETCEGCENPNENIVLRTMPGKYLAISDSDSDTFYSGDAGSYLFPDFIQIGYNDFSGGQLSFSFDLPETADLSSEVYEGPQSWYYNKPVTVGEETFNLPVKLEYSNLHQFYMVSGQEIVATPSGSLNFVTFLTTGIPSLNPGSSSLISRYEGRFMSQMSLPSSSETASTLSTMTMAVNWQYKTLFGALDFGDEGHILENAFFIGTIGEGQKVQLDLFGFYPGTSGESDTLSWISEQETTPAGQFYGAFQEGFDFKADGEAALATDTTHLTDWAITGGALMDPSTRTETMSGAESLQGFAVGVNTVLNGTSKTNTILMSDTSDDVSIAIDKNQGTLSASIAVTDGTTSLSTSLGGAADSCFVDDQTFIARTATGAASPGVLVTAPSDDQFTNSDVTWGYWGVYENGTTDGYWVAGKRATLDQISAKLTGGTTLEYKGTALGREIDASGVETLLKPGVSTVELDFAAHTASGKLDFPNVDINFGATGLTADGAFIGAPTGMDSGTVTGALFGQGAGTVAGGFDATNDGTRYMGIYEATLNRQQ